jgi:hypothetical protein
MGADSLKAKKPYRHSSFTCELYYKDIAQFRFFTYDIYKEQAFDYM